MKMLLQRAAGGKISFFTCPHHDSLATPLKGAVCCCWLILFFGFCRAAKHSNRQTETPADAQCLGKRFRKNSNRGVRFIVKPKEPPHSHADIKD